jgi:hypothetical protein
MATTTTNYGFDVPTSSDLVKNGATQIALLGQDLDTFLFRPFTKNAVINGAFDIAQRGTSVAVAASTNTNTLDRFQLNVGANGASTVSQQPTNDTTNLPNIRYCARVQRNSGQTGTSIMYFASSMETSTCVPYAGQTITFSFYARAGANFSSASNALNLTLRSGTGTDQNVYGYTGGSSPINTTKTLTTTWQRFTATATIATNATELAFYFNYTPVGTAGANDYFEVTAIQLEVGSQASPFTRAAETIQGELAACKRYLPSVLVGSGNSLTGYATSTTNSYVCAQFDVQARVAPTGITVSGSSYTLFAGGGGSGTPTAIAFDSAGVNSTLIQVTTTAASPTLLANNAVALRSTAAASQILFTGCEL